jgi:hypothetical protein
MTILEPTAVWNFSECVHVHRALRGAVARLAKAVDQEVVLVVELVFSHSFHIDDGVVIDPNRVVGAKLLGKGRRSEQRCDECEIQYAFHTTSSYLASGPAHAQNTFPNFMETRVPSCENPTSMR